MYQQKIFRLLLSGVSNAKEKECQTSLKEWMAKGPKVWGHEELDIMKRIKKNILANGGLEITKAIDDGEEGDVGTKEPGNTSEEPVAKKQKQE